MIGLLFVIVSQDHNDLKPGRDDADTLDASDSPLQLDTSAMIRLNKCVSVTRNMRAELLEEVGEKSQLVCRHSFVAIAIVFYGEKF